MFFFSGDFFWGRGMNSGVAGGGLTGRGELV